MNTPWSPEPKSLHFKDGKQHHVSASVHSNGSVVPKSRLCSTSQCGLYLDSCRKPGRSHQGCFFCTFPCVDGASLATPPSARSGTAASADDADGDPPPSPPEACATSA